MRAVVQPTLLPTKWPSDTARSVTAVTVLTATQAAESTQSIDHVSTTGTAGTLAQTAGATIATRVTTVTTSSAIAGRTNASAATTFDVVVKTACGSNQQSRQRANH